jgi:rare lipoprotein A
VQQFNGDQSMKQFLSVVMATLGALFGFSVAATTDARADWRDSILGQRSYDSAPQSTPRAARTASKAVNAKSKSSKVASSKASAGKSAKRVAKVAAPTERRVAKASRAKPERVADARPARRVASRSGISRPERALAKPIYGGGSGGEQGVASYYWQPQALASGGRFDPNAMTAAHKTLPFGTKVRVTDKSTGKSVVVTINDRGPYIAGRIIDLSKAAAGSLGIQGRGVAPVSVTRL